MPESTYSVYLVQRHGAQGGEREVTSPVDGHELEFYDTGVWLDRETGRNFFPYEQIRTIREHSDGTRPTESQPTGEGQQQTSEGTQDRENAELSGD